MKWRSWTNYRARARECEFQCENSLHCSSSSQLQEAAGASRAERPSATFEAIYDRFYTHIKIFIPDLALVVCEEKDFAWPLFRMLGVSRLLHNPAKVSDVGSRQGVALSTSTVVACIDQRPALTSGCKSGKAHFLNSDFLNTEGISSIS